MTRQKRRSAGVMRAGGWCFTCCPCWIVMTALKPGRTSRRPAVIPSFWDLGGSFQVGEDVALWSGPFAISGQGLCGMSMCLLIL